ncbi:MAG: hypothetical protein V2I43_13925 [Parvularcula sp.]|nr:hypothetical protein [Parvularcula sp.]
MEGRVANADRSHLYLDFDSFFASAEQHFNPSLRGKPIGVVPLDVRGTGCIAISREAKALGVPGNVSVIKARAAAPDMVFVVARPDTYVRLHHKILAATETCLPVASVRSIDELVCELLPSEQVRAIDLARQIKTTLLHEFSEALTCSIGLAQTELLAKIAAEMNKPDGLVVFDQKALPKKIADLPLGDIPGISSGIAARLAAANIRDSLALWNMSAKQCRALWGSIEGERFWNALHGLPYERPETEKRMFGHSRMLPLDWRSPDKVHDCARQLLLSAARRLRRHDLRASKLTLSARGGGYRSERRRKPDDKRWNCEISIRPASDDRALLHGLAQATATYQREVRFAPRSISVVLHGLADAKVVQGELFAPLECGHSQERARSERLSSALDQLRERHGPVAATMGMHASMPGGYLGGKIAFGRIPDSEDFNEPASADHETHFCQVA